jgi:hypothetical protein
VRRAKRSEVLMGVGLFFIFLTGCHGDAIKPENGSLWIQTTLYFGRNIGDQEGVTEAAWSKFLKDTVSPRFPNGLTVEDGVGQYFDTDNKALIQERTKILTLLYEESEETKQKINEIIDRYKKRFRQQSVLKVRQSVGVGFR